ncbi:hypothetical protein SUGI_0825400 [Cryptomeria japonica]|uniref:probable histidine kinase 6 isoform X2 n=1 Tax=Cryptomeria japonica TaxID=3369 RepID=UPI002414B3B9|nr:probable histidine kinase 6 isoform X2 [Cryptomeria japonica]GLJ40220.1 hypothetical protein SUGI_0825400 [Cryptomeria japonica]
MSALSFVVSAKISQRLIQACRLWLPHTAPELKMLTQSCGLLGGSMSDSIHHTTGFSRLFVKWSDKFTGTSSMEQQPHRQTLKPSKLGGTWRTKLLILWVLCGVIGSIWLFLSMKTDINERRKEILASMCDERARMLQDQFEVSMNHVHALAILISTFHHRKQPSAMNQKTFAEYAARTSFERPLVSGVSYAQRVLHAEREQFEREQGWSIKNMETNETSSEQDEYAPVIFSQDTVSYIASLDMMSGKEDRENILRARASGRAVLTSPFRLLNSTHLGVVLTFAVYKIDLPSDSTPEERIQATAGYLGGAFDVESLVKNLLRQLAGNQAITVNVYDMTNSSEPLRMYGPDVTDDEISHISLLDFGDPVRKHEMRCRYNQRQPPPWSAITTSAGILVIVLLVGHIFHAAIIRIAKVEDDFRKMEELKGQAEAADIAKSQFLATVSHEIRTPMNGVLGMLQMLMDTELDPTQLDYACTAQASGKALIKLINEVLDQAKIESGKIELEAVPFDLRDILDDVLSLFSGKSRENNVELAVFVSDQVPDFLIGDPGRFRQIIINLVGNSIKFTKQGHIFLCVYLAEQMKTVMENNRETLSKWQTEGLKNCSSSWKTLSGYETADGRNSWETFKLVVSNAKHLQSGTSENCVSDTSATVRLIVSVEDTGIGIPLDKQKHVFVPFMQVDSSTSRKYGGTGIGLSISRCLVELMSGELNFVSRPGVGSTFTFSIVLRKAQTRSQEDLNPSLPTCLKGRRAIVVDGRAVRAAVTKSHLQRLGVQVETVHDFNSTLAALLGERNDDIGNSGAVNADVIIVDDEAWGPGTGLAFPQILRESMGKGKLGTPKYLPKMILLATSINNSESEKAKAAGFLETVIVKPLRASAVAAYLQQALGIGNGKQPGKRITNGPISPRSLLLGKKILVVDDNKVNLRVAAGALEKYGASVECAEGGKIAVAKLQPPHSFDACFMDVQMPEIDGFEATRQVRNLETLRNNKEWHVPILAMTADVIHATYEECLRCGMDGYVSKPFEEEQLYRAVAPFLESQKKRL